MDEAAYRHQFPMYNTEWYHAILANESCFPGEHHSWCLIGELRAESHPACVIRPDTFRAVELQYTVVANKVLTTCQVSDSGHLVRYISAITRLGV